MQVFTFYQRKFFYVPVHNNMNANDLDLWKCCLFSVDIKNGHEEVIFHPRQKYAGVRIKVTPTHSMPNYPPTIQEHTDIFSPAHVRIYHENFEIQAHPYNVGVSVLPILALHAPRERFATGTNQSEIFDN